MAAKVGFYGCEVLDRVVRVGLRGEGNTPKVATVSCPCGNRHKVRFAWRYLRKGERSREEVFVEPREVKEPRRYRGD